MKKLLPIIAVIIYSCNAKQQAYKTNTTINSTATSPAVYAKTITQEDLKAHLYTYASDEFEGRETGTEGQKKAVAYLVEQYKKMGVAAAKNNGDYLQKVPLEITSAPTGTITVNEETYEIGNDFVTFSTIEAKTNELVYANYGIVTQTYSDYEGIDVRDKVVLVRFGEPKNADGTYVITKTEEPSKWGNFNESLADRLKIAGERGAKAILLWGDDNYPRLKSRYDYVADSNRNSMALSSSLTSELTPIFIGGALAERLSQMTKDRTGPGMLDLSLQLDIRSSNNAISSENVLAIIPGNTLPNEYVIISSHLDHIGVNEDGQVNNGADDDGSGTVAMLEIAQALKKAENEGDGPRRSVVFLHVTGEEKGLLGSRYYTDFDPIFPLENTVANLNIDMVGRIDPKRYGDRNYIYLIGSDKLSTELHELSEAANQKFTQLQLDYTYNDENDPNRFYYRSDHYNFAKNNIPIIFYFNGTHADYHKPSDTPDKINYDLLENRARLVFHTAWEVANRQKRVVVDKAPQ